MRGAVRALWATGLLATGLLAGSAAAQPAAPASSTAQPVTPAGARVLDQPERGPVPLRTAAGAASHFQARADAWFKAPKADPDARRGEMRAVSAALKQACRYCHTPAFDGYTDRLEVSRQMMALSAEHGVTCQECHAGKSDYTELGRKAIRMWQLSHEQGRFCEACHEPGQRFGKLNAEGLRFQKADWPAWSKNHPLPAAPAAPASAP